MRVGSVIPVLVRRSASARVQTGIQRQTSQEGMDSCLRATTNKRGYHKYPLGHVLTMRNH